MTKESLIEWAASWVPLKSPLGEPGQRERFTKALSDEIEALRDAALEEAALIADKHWPESGHVHQEGAISCQMTISVDIRRLKSSRRRERVSGAGGGEEG